MLQFLFYLLQILNIIPNESDGEHFEDALARVIRCVGGGNATDNADSDSDLEVVSDTFSVNLRCPVRLSIKHWIILVMFSVFLEVFVFIYYCPFFYTVVSLQMSGSRMKIAGRFKHCVHMGCFDLEVFVAMNQRSRKVSL